MTADEADTLRDVAMKLFDERGLLSDTAEAIFAALKDEPFAKSIKWRTRVSEYPDTLVVIVHMSVLRFAGEWLKKNQPKHWARPMFASTDEERDAIIAEMREG